MYVIYITPCIYWNNHPECGTRNFTPYNESVRFRRLLTKPILRIQKECTNFVIIGIYVYDFPISLNSTTSMQQVITQLKEKFPMKDLGWMKDFLGIKVTRNRIKATLSLSQNKFEMADCKPISTPMSVPCKLSGMVFTFAGLAIAWRTKKQSSAVV